MVICADNTDDKTMLLIKMNTPLATAPIPPAISWLCRFNIASVLVLTSPWRVLKAVVVALLTSHDPTVAICLY